MAANTTAPNLLSGFQQMLPTGMSMQTIMSWLIWVAVAVGIIIAIAVIGFMIWRNKVYKFPVTIFSERSNGVAETYDKGAFLRRKISKVPYFRLLKRKKEIMQHPMMNAIAQNTNRLYFYQKDMDTYIQLRPVIDDKILRYEPIDTDLKYGAIIEIQKIRDVVAVENKFMKFAPWFGLVILFVAAIVFLYMLVQKFDPSIAQKTAELVKEASENMLRIKGMT
jgi:hypothetical protein